MKRESFLLGAILLLASVLRFWQLGIIPLGVTHDELGYIFNAYSIAKTGKNVFGETLPFLTWMAKGGWPFMPVPIYFSVPFFWFLDASATTGRLPSAILGVLDVLLIYILIKQIFKNKLLALLSGFFLAISPWHLHFSRSAYDPNYALFFYLLSIVIFLYEMRRDRIPIFSILSFLLAIHSYRGMSIISLPLFLILITYSLLVIKTKLKQALFFSIGVLFIFATLFFVIIKNGNAYFAEGTLLFNNPKMQEDIDVKIRQAKGPTFVRRLFINKPIYIADKLRENYIKAYSPEFLFLYTEPHQIYSIWSRGRLYFIDLIFIILGIAYLYKTNKKGGLFITSLLLIGGLPSAVAGFPVSARIFFLSAIFPIFSAGGILFLLQVNLFKKIKFLTIILLFIIYLFLLGSYLFDYYYRYAQQGAEAWAKSLKDLSFLILENKQKYSNIIVSTTSYGDFMQYAFYAKLSPEDVQRAWNSRNKLSNESFKTGNVVFTYKCMETKDLSLLKKSSILYITRDQCNKTATPSASIKDYFGNTIWKIYRE